MPTNSSFVKWVFGGEMLEDAKTWPRQFVECFFCCIGIRMPVWFGPKSKINVFYDEIEIGYCPGVKLGVKKIVKALNKARAEFNVVYYKGVPNQCNELIQKLRWALFPLVPYNKKLGERAYHAISPYGETPEEMLSKKLVDLTCSSVKKVIETAKKWYAKGYKVIIMGEQGEWEPRIVNSHINYDGIIVEYIVNIESMVQEFGNKIVIITQTSFSLDLFEANVQKICEKNPSIDIVVERTFCPAVERRIESALRLSESCNFMIIVGDKNSNQGSYIRRRLWEKGVFCFDLTKYDLIPNDAEIFENIDTIGVVGTTTVSKKDVMRVVKSLIYPQCTKKLYNGADYLVKNPCHGCPEQDTCDNVSGGFCLHGRYSNLCPNIIKARNLHGESVNKCTGHCYRCPNKE